ncbi:hypothetical protein SCUP515_05866 [Seiridium cupressi]
MPHKHTRREKDPSSFDLPPTQIARPLPVKPSFFSKPDEDAGKGKGSGPGKNLKRKRDGMGQNDMPRAFRRLMAYSDGKKPRSGLDNGDAPSGKQKKGKKAGKESNAETAAEAPTEKSDVPVIRPGERMSEFAARVDAALPIGGLINKSARNGKDPLGLKVKRTKKERQMHRLYDEWREEERKIKEQRDEELELLAEKELEDEEAGVSWKQNAPPAPLGKKKKKKGKRAKYLDEVGGDEEDPWEELKRKRGESRPGLHDIAKAPPELHLKTPKKLTVRGATVAVDGIPKAAGSLRRREELQEVRDDIVATYRKMMDEKRPSLRQS